MVKPRHNKKLFVIKNRTSNINSLYSGNINNIMKYNPS